LDTVPGFTRCCHAIYRLRMLELTNETGFSPNTYLCLRGAVNPGPDTEIMTRGHRRWRYNAAASIVDVPLTLDEVEDLLDNFDKAFLRDESAVEHFILRVLASLKAAREVRSNIDHEINRRTAMMPSQTQGSLSPEQAVRYLTQEQLEPLFDRFKQQQLELLRGATDRAEATSLRQRAALDALEHLALNIGADPSVPHSAREQIMKALDYARRSAEEDEERL